MNVTSLPLKGTEDPDGSGDHAPASIPTTIAFPHLFNRIADIIVMYNGNGFNGSAYEAVFYYCIQEFSTNVTNGVVQTSQTWSWVNDTDSNGAEPLSDFPTTLLTDPLHGGNYGVQPEAVWAIRNFTNEIMTGEVTFEDTVAYSSGFVHVVGLLGGVFNDHGDFSSLQPPQQTVNGRLALEAVMQNIARSLSNK